MTRRERCASCGEARSAKNHTRQPRVASADTICRQLWQGRGSCRAKDAPDETPATPALPWNKADPDRLARRRPAAQQLELDALALPDLAGERLEAVVVVSGDGTERKQLVVRSDALCVRD
jgi:hypothetical protein